MSVFVFMLQCVLDGRRDLLPCRSRLEFLRVPTRLLVNKPGIACPHKHVEEAKHLEEQEHGKKYS